jgi:hypothetical protein
MRNQISSTAKKKANGILTLLREMQQGEAGFYFNHNKPEGFCPTGLWSVIAYRERDGEQIEKDFMSANSFVDFVDKLIIQIQREAFKPEDQKSLSTINANDILKIMLLGLNEITYNYDEEITIKFSVLPEKKLTRKRAKNFIGMLIDLAHEADKKNE